MDCIERLEEREPYVRAWAHFDANHALAEAKKADQRQKEGKKLGLLHGIPIGIKDVIDAKGMPGENGSPIFANRVPCLLYTSPSPRDQRGARKAGSG